MVGRLREGVAEICDRMLASPQEGMGQRLDPCPDLDVPLIVTPYPAAPHARLAGIAGLSKARAQGAALVAPI